MARFLHYSSPSPHLDIALEEALHVGVEKETSLPTWRVWEAATPAIIVGTGQKVELEVNVGKAEKAGVPIIRRHSGGGTVLIGPGVLQYSAFLPYTLLADSGTITGAMESALAPVRTALASMGVQTVFAGLSDLAVPTNSDNSHHKKIAGNSQARKRLSVTVHGTLLADPNMELLETLLHYPSKSPDYRNNRKHGAFLTNLKSCNTPSDLPSFAEKLEKSLAGELWASTSKITAADSPTDEELQAAQDLLKEKYTQKEWNFRR